MNTPRKNWSEDEVRKALSLYLVTDFGRIHNGNKDIINLANSIGRTPNAVALKMANLAALDETLPRKGMANASKLDKAIWSEFLRDPNFVLRDYQNLPVTAIDAVNQLQNNEANGGFSETSYSFSTDRITDKLVNTTQRVGQDFFRKMILTSYRSECALTGIEDTRLLNASHIVAWKDDVANRLNPTNGICLNALHDRAFDRHLITFDEDYRLVIANNIPHKAKEKLAKVETERLCMPSRFLPSQEFLETHRQIFHQKSETIQS
ncbi:MAG: HNH endonuclease [Aquisalinus sp.]|nr:HNH endonuclease [Aquisalinus sp.]